MARMRNFDPANFKDIAASSLLNDAVGASWAAVGKPINVLDALAKKGDQLGKPEIAKELARRMFDAGFLVVDTNSYLATAQLDHIAERANRAEVARLKAAAKKASQKVGADQGSEDNSGS